MIQNISLLDTSPSCAFKGGNGANTLETHDQSLKRGEDLSKSVFVLLVIYLSTSRHINPSLILVQPSKTLLTRDCCWDVKNQMKQTKSVNINLTP